MTRSSARSPRPSPTSAPPTSSSARSSPPARVHSASSCPKSSAACWTRCRRPIPPRCTSCSPPNSVPIPRSCSPASMRNRSLRRRSPRCTSPPCTPARTSSLRSSARVSGAGWPPTFRSSSASPRWPNSPRPGVGSPPRMWWPTSPTTSPRNSTSASRRSQWRPGCRACTARRWAAISKCPMCTGSSPVSGC